MTMTDRLSSPGDEARHLGMLANQALAAAPISLSSHDESEASDQLSHIYNSNRLRRVGRRSSFRMALRKSSIGQLELATLSFGASVNLEQAGDRPFVLVTTQIRGHSEVRTATESAAGGPGFIVVDSAGQSVSKSFSDDSQRCNVRIDQAVIEAKCAELLQRPLNRPLRFSAFGGNHAVVQQRWFALLQMLLGHTQHSQPARLIVRNIEESVLLHLLLEHPHSFSAALHQDKPDVVPRHVKRAEDYMRANASEPITLEMLARQAGCSIRSLNQGFQQFRETTPMRFLRQIRLEGAHADLRQENAASQITEIALRWGFGHLGRFASEYRNCFGELPSATARAKK